jgi:hypothetical protein
MALRIETFDNRLGGNAFYKAVVHPLAAEKGRALFDQLTGAGPVAIYDPQSLLEGFAEMYDLGRLDIAGLFVQSARPCWATIVGR